jgi:hypothetical protein
MGRPLKIAKAQTVLTITDTATTGSVVTISGGNLITSPTVGVTSGMSFVPAASISGLVANTIYYVDTILTNTTFSVSTTQRSVQPRVMATLTNSTGGTVKASFNVVDAYFNNPLGGTGFPTTNSNTYSVVGGNTAIIGPQVLAQVAIGINGTGTLYSTSGNANVFGVGTDLANTLSVGSAIQVGVANINGSTDYANLGFAATLSGYANIEISNATATGNFLTSVGNAQTLFANQPVVLSANIGGLRANTTYFVNTIANAAAFSVSSYVGGANVPLTNQNATSYAVQDRVILSGATTTTAANAPFIYANDEAGYIVRQKGKQKYLVTGGTTGLTAQCLTANVANANLTPNTMTILATYGSEQEPIIQNVQYLSDHNAGLFTANSSPIATANIVSPGQPTGNLGYINTSPIIATFNSSVTTITAGSFVVGVAYVIVSLGNTNWAAVGANNASVGAIFTATGVGSGTGTVSIAGAIGPILTIANA